MYDIFEELLSEKGVTAYRVAKETGLSTATLTQWKNGTSTPKQDKLQLIADYFGVSIDYLLGNTTLIRCRDCDYEYSTSDKLQVRAHEIEHNKWRKAVDKFGFCWTYSVSEKEKAKSRSRLDNEALTYEEKVNENINIFKALYSRSLSVDFDLNHPDFNSYVSMLLNQKQFQKSIEPEIYDHLVGIYGKQKGIDEGETYFCPPKGVTTSSTIAAHFDGSEFTAEEIEEIKQFAEFVKNRRK